jgi:hypothetical protein
MIFSKDHSINQSLSSVFATLPRLRIAVPVIRDRHAAKRRESGSERKTAELEALLKSDLSDFVKDRPTDQARRSAQKFSRVNRARNPAWFDG